MIMEMREEGLAYSKIGRLLGICGWRVSQIYNHEKRSREERLINPFKHSLSIRLRNGLINYYGDHSIFDHPKLIAETGYARLCYTKNLGHLSLVELAEKLEELGYINAATWIAEGKTMKRQVYYENLRSRHLKGS